MRPRSEESSTEPNQCPNCGCFSDGDGPCPDCGTCFYCGGKGTEYGSGPPPSAAPAAEESGQPSPAEKVIAVTIQLSVTVRSAV